MKVQIVEEIRTINKRKKVNGFFQYVPLTTTCYMLKVTEKSAAERKIFMDGYSCADDRLLAERLKRAMDDGALKEYFMMKYINSDLKKLGY